MNNFYPMGADLIYSMMFMEVSEEEARRRVNELNFEKLTETEEFHGKDHYVLTTHESHIEDLLYKIEELPYEEADEARQKEAIEHMKNNFVDSIKSDANKALDVAFGAWTHGKYPRDVAPFNVKGTKGLITAGMSCGDSWETLEQFHLLNILEITCEREE